MNWLYRLLRKRTKVEQAERINRKIDALLRKARRLGLEVDEGYVYAPQPPKPVTEMTPVERFHHEMVNELSGAAIADMADTLEKAKQAGYIKFQGYDVPYKHPLGGS